MSEYGKFKLTYMITTEITRQRKKYLTIPYRGSLTEIKFRTLLGISNKFDFRTVHKKQTKKGDPKLAQLRRLWPS